MKNNARTPAEWEHHQCTWMAWPARLSLWPNFNDARMAYANVINQLSHFEKVQVLHLPEESAWIKKLCTSVHTDFIPCALNDSWARDIFPSFALNQGFLEVIEWQFNGWGEKFIPHDDDAKVAAKISAFLQQSQQAIHLKKVDLVLEGGSLHTNGQGLGITTTSCLLEPKRNPQYSKKEIESIIKDHLYLHELLWLPDGIDGDKDTDGHIDNFACFIDPQTLILQKPNENDAQGLALYKKNLIALQQMKERTNFQWVEGPTAPLLIDNGIKLPVSYINFVFCNQGLLLPQFDQKRHDANALAIFKELFPNRVIIPCPALCISQGGGGLHCITHEQPASIS